MNDNNVDVRRKDCEVTDVEFYKSMLWNVPDELTDFFNHSYIKDTHNSLV